MKFYKKTGYLILLILLAILMTFLQPVFARNEKDAVIKVWKDLFNFWH
jgi:hypothetical protein